MNKRLSQLRKALNLSMEEFGKKIGVGRSTISRLESGTNNFTDQMIRSICREFNVNYSWLVSGTGDMFDEVPQTSIDELCSQYGLDDFDRVLILEYLKMSADARKALNIPAGRTLESLQAELQAQAQAEQAAAAK